MYFRATLAAFLFALFPGVAMAQESPIDKGSAIIGGSVSFSSWGGELYENSDGDRYTSALLNPRALFFVTRGLAIGGNLYIESESQGDFDATTISAGPAIAYFFGENDSSTYPFIGASVGYSKVSTSGLDGSGLVFVGVVGADFMLSRSVAIGASANYRVESVSIDQADESFSGNGIVLMLGVDAFLW